MADVDFLQLGLLMRKRTHGIGARSVGQHVWAEPSLSEIWGRIEFS